MLASGPNTTCPEAHPINSQQSGKRSQLPAVHMVHLFTHSCFHPFHLGFHPGKVGGGKGGDKGQGGARVRGARSDLMQAPVCQAVATRMAVNMCLHIGFDVNQSVRLSVMALPGLKCKCKRTNQPRQRF